MRIVPLARKHRKPKIQGPWKEVDNEEYPLVEVVSIKRPPTRHGQELYFIRFGTGLLYIGMTVVGFERRLFSHMFEAPASRIGQCLRAAHPSYYEWTVQIVTIQGDLAFCEFAYINHCQPILNLLDTYNKRKIADGVMRSIIHRCRILKQERGDDRPGFPLLL